MRSEFHNNQDGVYFIFIFSCTQIEKDLFASCATLVSDLNRPEYCSFSRIVATKVKFYSFLYRAL